MSIPQNIAPLFKCVLYDCCLNAYVCPFFWHIPWIVIFQCMRKIHHFSMGWGWQDTVNSCASFNCQENLVLHLLVPLTPPSSSLLHHCLFLCGSRTAQMQRNGKWSGTMAFKALPLPCPSLFIFYPNKRWSRNQEAKLRNKSTRDQVGLSCHLAEHFFFNSLQSDP